MYEHTLDLLIRNGTRFFYTPQRPLGNILRRLQKNRPPFDFEVSANEKIAYELALAGSWGSKRTSCLFSTEGLYEALDPLMSSAYTGVAGGLLIICFQDTPEEVTPLGPFSKIPLLVCESAELLAMSIPFGYTLSEKYEIPVIIQTTPEADMGITAEALEGEAADHAASKRKFKFVRNQGRWAATPKFRYVLHKELTAKTEQIRNDFESFRGNTLTKRGNTGLITTRSEIPEFFDDDASLLRLCTVYPAPHRLIEAFIGEMEEVYVAESAYRAIELQLRDRQKVRAFPLEAGGRRVNPEEMMYGFVTVRDTLGPASSINMAHGMKSSDPGKKVLAITYEDYFYHSGMPAFVNTLYNNSSYVLLVMTNEKEEEMKGILRGLGFGNFYHIDVVSEVERFKDHEEMTVLFCKGIA
jgi:TPP-dependent indolepyruvate ferredoxin oxidoreductase alpha subunit